MHTEIRKVAFLGDYLPRKCGIATFTSDPHNSIAGQFTKTRCFVVPVNDLDCGYEYPGEVRFEIAEQDLLSYRRAADFLNLSNAVGICPAWQLRLADGTEAGWLVLSHGVGPMRKYCVGAFLLDRDDPSKLIGCLRDPLITPTAEEREGYVPNVVYSCGGLIHNGYLVLPYAMADHATTFSTIAVDQILSAMEMVG